ncbi:hypothetical protein Golob_022808, partial [Gossypium lobatum]|nr:hypothetical protein [Gossypium lobatum]
SSPFSPLPQDDGLNPLIPIAYKEEFHETITFEPSTKPMNAPLVPSAPLDETSISILVITLFGILGDSLEALNTDLDEELDFLQWIANSNSKNY